MSNTSTEYYKRNNRTIAGEILVRGLQEGEDRNRK